MPLACDELSRLFSNFSLLRECAPLDNGTLRVSTSFQYPNGSLIDVFVQDGRDLFDRNIVLSDFGQTAIYLRNLPLAMDSTKRRKQLVADICESLGIGEENNQLVVRLSGDEVDKIPEAMVRLSQACIRVADLSFMQRFPVTVAFKDDIEEFIARMELPYETDPPPLEGAYGRTVPVDFRVHGKRDSLVKTLSTANPSMAHDIMNETFRCWFDIALFKDQNQFVTVIDDRELPNQMRQYRDDDMARIRNYSKLFAFPSQRDQLEEALLEAA